MDPIKDGLIEYFKAKGKPISPEVADKVAKSYNGNWDGLRRDLQQKYGSQFDAALFNEIWTKGNEKDKVTQSIKQNPAAPKSQQTSTNPQNVPVESPQQTSAGSTPIPAKTVQPRSGLDYAAEAANQPVEMTQDRSARGLMADPVVAPPVAPGSEMPVQVKRDKVQTTYDPVQRKTVEIAPVALPELPQNPQAKIKDYVELPGYEQYFKDNTGEDYQNYLEGKSKSKTGKVEQYAKMGETYFKDMSEYSNFLFAEVMDKAGFKNTEEIQAFNKELGKISVMINQAQAAGDDKAVAAIVERNKDILQRFEQVRNTPGYGEYEKYRNKLDTEIDRYYTTKPQDVREAAESLDYIQNTIDRNDENDKRGFWNNSGSFGARFLARTASRLTSLYRDPVVRGIMATGTMGISEIDRDEKLKGLATIDGIADDFIAEYQVPTRLQRGAWENVGQMDGMDLIFDNKGEKIVGVYNSKTGNRMTVLTDMDQLKKEFDSRGGKIERGKFREADVLWTKGFEVALDLIPQIAIGRLTGRGLVGAGIGKNAASTAAVVGSTYAQVQSDFYKAALEALQDDEQASLMALGQGAAVGAIALISPLEKQMLGLTAGSMSKSAARRAIETALGGGLKLAKNDLIQLGKNAGAMVLAGVGETSEEGLEYLVPERVMPALVNQVMAGEFYNNSQLQINPNELKEIAAISMGVGMIGKAGVLANNNTTLKALEAFARSGNPNNVFLNHVLNDDKHLDFVLSELQSKNVISKEKATAMSNAVKAVKERVELSKDFMDGMEANLKPAMFLSAYGKEMQEVYKAGTAENKSFGAMSAYAEGLIEKLLNNQPLDNENKTEGQTKPEAKGDETKVPEPDDLLKPIVLDDTPEANEVIANAKPFDNTVPIEPDSYYLLDASNNALVENLKKKGINIMTISTRGKGLLGRFGKEKTSFYVKGSDLRAFYGMPETINRGMKDEPIEDAIIDDTPEPAAQPDPTSAPVETPKAPPAEPKTPKVKAEPKGSPEPKTDPAKPKADPVAEPSSAKGPSDSEKRAIEIKSKMDAGEDLSDDDMDFIMSNPDAISKLTNKKDDKPRTSDSGSVSPADPKPAESPKQTKKVEPVPTKPDSPKKEVPEEVDESQDDEQDTDINEARRKKGRYTVGDVEYVRPGMNTVKPTGKKGTIKYADDVDDEFEWALIEEEDLQPAHYQGVRNRKNFIPEAQPKDRKGADSMAASDKIAANIDVSRLLDSRDAYQGSPTVLPTGELIQGNNRAEGIKKHYQGGNTKYKEELIKNAEAIGATPEQIAAMKAPVAVRVLKVSDDRAIELGNYDASDLESGGNIRIDPVRTARKIPLDKKKQIATILAQKDSTFAQAIRDSFNDIMKILKPKYINSSRYRSLVNAKGEPTSMGIKDLELLIKEFLFVGGDPELSTMFDKLPSKIQEGLIKAVPYILSTGKKDSIRPEIQEAIQIMAEYLGGQQSFVEYKNSINMFSGTTPQDMYSKTGLAIAEKILETDKEKEITALMYAYNASITGVNDMFEVIAPVSKREAISATFGITPKNEETIGKAPVVMEKAEVAALLTAAKAEGFFKVSSNAADLISNLFSDSPGAFSDNAIKYLQDEAAQIHNVYNNLLKSNTKQVADDLIGNSYRLASLIDQVLFRTPKNIKVVPGVKTKRTGNEALDAIIDAMEKSVAILSNFAPEVEGIYSFNNSKIKEGVNGQLVTNPAVGTPTKLTMTITNRKGNNPAVIISTVFHETMHAVERNLRDNNPDVLTQFQKDIISLIPEYSDFNAFIGKFVAGYTKAYDGKTLSETRQTEALVEFFGKVASGNIKLTQKQQSIVARFIDAAIALLEKALKMPKGSIGKLIPTERARIIHMANVVSNMLREGENPVPYIVNQYEGSKGSQMRASAVNNLTKRGFSKEYAEKRVALETHMPVQQIIIDGRDESVMEETTYSGYDITAEKIESNNNPRVTVTYNLDDNTTQQIDGMLASLIRMGKYNINDILNKISIAMNVPLSDVKNVYFSGRMDARSGKVLPRTWMDRFMNDMSINEKTKDKITREGYLYEEISNEEAYARAEELIDAYIKGYGDVNLALETLYEDILENSSDKPDKPGLNPAIAVFAYMQIIRKAEANGNEDLASRVATYKAYLGTIKGQFIQALRGTAGPDNLISIAFEDIDKRRNAFLGTQLRSGRNFTDVLNEFKDKINLKDKDIDDLKSQIKTLLGDLSKADKRIKDLLAALANMGPAPGTGNTPGSSRPKGTGTKKKVSAPKRVKDALNKLSDALFGSGGSTFEFGVNASNDAYEAVGEMFLGLMEETGARGQRLIAKVAQLLAEVEDANGFKLTEEEIIDMIYGGLNDSSSGMLVKDQIVDNTIAMPLDPSLLIGRIHIGTDIEEIMKRAIDFTYSKENRAGLTLSQVMLMDAAMPQDPDSEQLAKDIEAIISKDLQSKFRDRIQREVADYAKNPDVAGIFTKFKRNPTKMDKLIEATSMGMLSHSKFSNLAAELFADIQRIPPEFVKKVEKVVKDIKTIGDVTGSKELKAVKIRELAMTLNEIKPAFHPDTLFDELYTVLVNHALSGINTIFNANFAGVLAAIPKLAGTFLYRPGASFKAFKSYQKMLRGTGMRSFIDAVSTNFSTLDNMGTYFDTGTNQKVTLSEYLAINGVGMLYKRAEESRQAGNKVQMWKELIAAQIMAPAMLTWRTTFLLKAFDAMYVHRMSEFFTFIEAYDQVARKDNKHGLLPTIQNWAGRKEYFQEVDKMLGYEEAKKALYEKKIEDEIIEMEVEGVDLKDFFSTFGGSLGYKKRRLKELMTEGQAADLRFRGVAMAKDAIMMGSPSGLPGMAYATMNKITNFDKDDAFSSGVSFAMKAVFGMFIRITANTVNRYTNGSPFGFAWNAVTAIKNYLTGKPNSKWVPNEIFQQTPKDLRSDRKNYIKVSNQEMAQNLTTGMMSIIAYAVLNALLFDDDDELLPESERMLDVTAQMTGNYFKNLESEPDNEEASFRVKWFGDKWSEPLKYVYVPDFGFTIALIGGKRDYHVYQKDTNQTKNPPGLASYMAASTLAYFSNLSFAANFGSIKKALDAHSAAQKDPEMGMEKVYRELTEIVARPVKTLMMSNLSRDVIMESRIAFDAITGEKTSVMRNNEGIMRFMKDLPYMEMLFSEERVDQFGYTIDRKSKAKATALRIGDIFSAGLGSNAYNNFVEETKDRFDQPAWRPAMKFTGTQIPGMWNPAFRFYGLDDEQTQRVQGFYTEHYRKTVERYADKIMRRKTKKEVEEDYDKIARYARDRAAWDAQKLGYEPNTKIKNKPSFKGL
jgi:hypothetical protein